jgi:hypothetical protein
MQCKKQTMLSGSEKILMLTQRKKELQKLDATPPMRTQQLKLGRVHKSLLTRHLGSPTLKMKESNKATKISNKSFIRT